MAKSKSRGSSGTARNRAGGLAQSLAAGRKRASKVLDRSLDAAAEIQLGRYAAIAGGVLVLGGLAAAGYSLLKANPELWQKTMTRLREMQGMVKEFTSMAKPAEEADAAPLH